VRRLERWFRRAAYPIVAIAPNNVVCVLAGAAGMSLVGFVIANLGGTAARMVLIWFVGDLFSDPLIEVVDFVARYRWIFTGVTVALVAWSVIRARRSRRSEIETVDEVAEELEAARGAKGAAAPTSTSEPSPPAPPE
jgi:uncharacterized membrane protein YdjX (TVP38/TMEM64 family)